MVAVDVHFKHCGRTALKDPLHRAAEPIYGFKILSASGDVLEDEENVTNGEHAIVVGVTWHPAWFYAGGLPPVGGGP